MILKDEAATARLGAAIARRLQAGESICLSGPLGAGKSTLARAL
ncbi:MAG TPA: tRNA (adenosine(37)-N6)-threonylcarbamoyltransferase complex ATPase subunit type 1 TsaE, partial [Phenylobacterium sp.]|nr:tRNA (adenosine(37)-N6)-threonylcarbamoyltransferase complex ATPase subunit type 1 TsaE [Phenylobacterium sp.]